MSIHKERAFEDEIVAHLGAHGWLVSPTDREPGAEYDVARALVPGDVFAWLETTQPNELAKIVKPDFDTAAKAKARQQLLDRLAKVLDTDPEHGGGTLNVLRKGFKTGPASFRMCQFRPATNINHTALEHYEAVRLRVMRQVHYSAKGAQSIDLVCFVNGLPVATLELKTDNVQSIDDAKNQYRFQRPPKGEPLLEFARRALVHFAVSNDEAWMTTKLAGKDTRFLPFNRGNAGRSGNPAVPGKSATSYLWEEILERHAWLHILGSLLHIETSVDIDPITGARSTRTTLLFPRYHQWDAVTRLLTAAKEDGPGQRYLIQHSAGSGKTNSIAWLAHGLSQLHDGQNDKIFDSVIVVTDRTVLDDQLQRAIQQIQGVRGVVATISPDAVRRLGSDDVKSKSALLAKELLEGRLIIVVTLQTFPFAMEAIRANTGLMGKRFAIIADEAHSSHTGRASQQLREVLSPEEIEALEDGGEIDTEAVLAAGMAQRADSPNLSFFAFTATPKSKTLELFGRKDASGQPRPFHVYTMQQAIEEGYILDVLQNYTSYDTAFKIAEKTRRQADSGENQTLVDERAATRGLMRWVSLHPTNIAQKVQIIVEHYREVVQPMLDGHAKAMVVTSSREHAARYKAAMDAYIAKQGYPLGTLVAMSGSLGEDALEPDVFPEATAPYSESNMNAGLRGRTIPAAFATDEYQVLIVANKYQTGFDQPLLCGMYVDKRLSGVTAVQTLSRLNRTYSAGGKDRTYVLDFVNDPDEILAAFRTYFRDATIEGNTDPDLVHDLRSKLETAGIFTAEDIDDFADAFVAHQSHGALQAPLQQAANRFRGRYESAMQSGNRTEVETLELFRKDVGTFIRLYDFLSQIVNYEDAGIEKLALFLRFLKRRLESTSTAEAVDLSGVELAAIRQLKRAETRLQLDDGESAPLKPMTVGGGSVHDPKFARLREIIERLNEMFGSDVPFGAVDSFQAGIVTNLEENHHLRDQAQVNSKSQFLQSPDLEQAVTNSLMGHLDIQGDLVGRVFANDDMRLEFMRLLGEIAYDRLREGNKEAGDA